MPTPTPYRTSDLYYAAYLRVASVHFLGVVWEGPKAWFEFEPGSHHKSLKDGYFNGTSRVSPLEYAKWVKALKALINASIATRHRET